jgi:hypothetical protein
VIAALLAGFLAVPAPATMQRGWRQSIEGPFSLFLPAAVRRVGPKKFDAIAGQFAGEDLRVSYDFGYYVPSCEDGDKLKIGGRTVELLRTAGEGGAITLTACFSAPRGSKRLTIRFDASTADAASDAETALESIRFAKP